MSREQWLRTIIITVTSNYFKTVPFCKRVCKN